MTWFVISQMKTSKSFFFFVKEEYQGIIIIIKHNLLPFFRAHWLMKLRGHGSHFLRGFYLPCLGLWLFLQLLFTFHHYISAATLAYRAGVFG